MVDAIKPLYTAHGTSTGGRNGHTRSDDGRVEVDLSVPKEMGGPGKPNTATPEHLFAAGYAACFGSACQHVARAQKLTTGPIAITAHVKFGPVATGFGLQVELVADIPELPRDQAEALIHRAHQVCPYSNATRNNIVVDLRLA
jgi:Ohr subfamily peroxiredoxin